MGFRRAPHAQFERESGSQGCGALTQPWQFNSPLAHHQQRRRPGDPRGRPAVVVPAAPAVPIDGHLRGQVAGICGQTRANRTRQTGECPSKCSPAPAYRGDVRAPRIVSALAALALLASACGSTGEGPTRSEGVDDAAPAAGLADVTGPLVVAVGDIACPPGAQTTPSACREQDTAALATSLRPRRVLALGDLQYDAGSRYGFRHSYAHSWGALRSITRPVPGNHEYRTAGAKGYYSYFSGRQPGAPGYYAYDVGSWRVYALNTNCGEIGCARENRWLARDMQRNPHRCTLLQMHHPRYSSGQHGSNAFVRPLWRTALAHGADVAVAGHDHHYERFRPMNAAGTPVRGGITSFVAGAGGRSLYGLSVTVAGSVVRQPDAFGVLALRLGKGRYAWEYRSVDGAVLDEGTRRCV